ncbi:MAG: hypothetical protein WCF13_06950, partial [Stellaceae bacterium]
LLELLMRVILETPASSLSEAYILVSVAQHEIDTMSAFNLDDDEARIWYGRVQVALSEAGREIARHASVSLESLGIGSLRIDRRAELAA